VLDAVVPPGHKYIGDALKPCDDGEYFPDWRKPTDAGVDKCKAPVLDLDLLIHSEPVEPIMKYTTNPATGAVTSTLEYVRRTSASCCKFSVHKPVCAWWMRGAQGVAVLVAVTAAT
jgi:hypothetical protein